MLVLPTALCFMFNIPFNPLIVATIGMFVMIVLFGWMFSVGAWSNSKLPAERRSNTNVFAISLIIPVIYILMYIIQVIPQITAGAPSDQRPLWMLPLHMLSMAGIFYAIWFTAQKFKSLLENEDADFLIFSSTFFLLFIFPIGIWIIQPNVNALYSKLTPEEMFNRDD